MYLFTDAVFIKNQILNVTGWASSEDGQEKAEFQVFSGSQETDFSLTRGSRPDVGYAMFKRPDIAEVGYFIQIPLKGRSSFRISGSLLNEEGEVKDHKDIVLNTRLLKVRDSLKKAKAWYVSKKYRDSSIIYKVWNKTLNKYNAWFKNFRTSPLELEEQRKTVFSYTPKISILTPVYRTPIRYLRELLGSVVNQSYTNFELCIVNADPSDEEVSRELKLWSYLDPRIKVKDLQENRSISENTNEALKMAEGEYIALLDHDDKLEYEALFRIVERLNEKPETDLLYSDEDKIGEVSDYYFFPNFKPDYNPDMLYGNNYICHFLCVRRSLAEEIGGWDPKYNGAQDYDFILKCTEKTERIEHIDRVLYHWRSHQNSTSGSMENKFYAQEAGRQALMDFFSRKGLNATVENAAVGGWYKTTFHMEEQPLISILIPSKDHSEDLDVCIQSLLNKCTYKNFEIIVIENNSTEQETFAYYEKIQRESDKVRVVTWPGTGTGFNYSAINNYGFSQSTGEYILLLNNDVEVISENLLESMLGYFIRKDVGMVGCKLLYKDKTIQHAGVLVGGGGLADHLLKEYKDTDPGYMCRAVTSYDVSAVTAACLMVRRDIYEEVGGLEEELQVAFNDVDFCLKVRKAGYRIVYDAYVKLFHYESKSRGSENTPQKYARFGREMDYLSRKWKDQVSFSDPAYNRNMSYLYNFIPDFFSIPNRSRELAEDFVSHTDDPVSFMLYMQENMNYRLKKQMEKMDDN